MKALRDQLEMLFDRCPDLCGFQVGERVVPAAQGEPGGAELELYISGVDVYPALGSAQSEALVAHISAALADFLTDSPEAADLLAGRTFARTVH
jgi:hypothetical protein